MKIGIIGPPKTFESILIEKEAERRGHKVVKFSTDELIYKVVNNKFTIDSPYDLKSFDIFLIRGTLKQVKIGKVITKTASKSFPFLRYVYDTLEKPIVDERIAKKPYIPNKIETSQILSRASLPTPLTYAFPNKRSVLKYLKKLPFPLIIKDLLGAKGQNIFKINSQEMLKKFLKKKIDIGQFEFQEYLPTDGDIRVLTVGYKAIGAMKRFVVPGDFVANISRGAKAEKFNLTSQIAHLAEKAAKATETEFAGVDLIESKGKFYIIEVNRAPQFKGFRKYTGIDPSPFIIDYLEEKYKRSS